MVFMRLKKTIGQLAMWSITFVGSSIIMVTTSYALTLDLPGFSVVNQFAIPSGVPLNLGDATFSADGNTLSILGGSENPNSGIWNAPVTRDGTGTMVGLGAAIPLFTSPNMDTSYERIPGSDTFIFRNAGGVGERRSDGTISSFSAGSATLGGVAFVPDTLPNSGDLLVGDWDTGVINSFALTDNGDGFFTPGPGVFYSNSQTGAIGDMQFIPTGVFANDLLFTNWTNGTIGIIDIDPSTGLPVGGGASPTITQFASGLGSGPWGLDFDPITNNLFVSNWAGSPENTIIQISGFPAPVPEPSTMILLGTGLIGLVGYNYRRNKKAA